MKKQPQNTAEWYDRFLAYILNKYLPRDIPWPQPTSKWPEKNVEILERYAEWRLAGGASPYTTWTIYAPTAGQVLGLALKPHTEFDLAEWCDSGRETEFRRAYAFILARNLSAARTKVCRNALENFRKFLRQARGLPEERKQQAFDVDRHTRDLPAWLVQELKNYQRIRQRNWRPARLVESITRFWSGYLRTWRFFVSECGVVELADLRRQHIFDYIDHRLALGRAISGVNSDLRALVMFLEFLQGEGYTVPQNLLRIPSLHQPARLPRHLTDEQVRLLRDEFERQVIAAEAPDKLRDALLDRAVFYLLWQGGLRISEVEEMRLEDLDFRNQCLTVRRSKGLKDRTVYLSASVCRALQAYLAVRGPASTEHVLVYRNLAIKKDLIRDRLKAAGKRVGVKVYPHRLRHTCATQLLNAGCRVTSIQKILGHKRLNSTMIYARVHDEVVAKDYYAAMSQIEIHLDFAASKDETSHSISEGDRVQLLELVNQLTEAEVDMKTNMKLVDQIRWILTGESTMNNS